jgi:hypothetical protein
MKKVNFNALDLDPETIGNLTDEQAEEVEGGGSCGWNSCNKAAALAEEAE